MNRFYVGALLMLSTAMLLGTPRMAHAAESYDNCTGFITSLPAVINTQGTWCLKQDLSTAMTGGYAITISANNVTIDCNDFKLGGLAAGMSTFAHGIHADGRLNATVRRCNIRGFYYGVIFGGSGGGHLIEDNRFDNNTYTAIYISGDGSVIRRNRISDSGGTSAGSDAIGIWAENSVDVVDNTVSGVTAGSSGNGSAYGIFTYLLSGGSIDNNKLRGMTRSGTGNAYGIYNLSSDRVSLRDNDIVGDASTGGIGLRCASTHDRAEGNVINGFVTGLDTCSDDGGNVIAP